MPKQMTENLNLELISPNLYTRWHLQLQKNYNFISESNKISSRRSPESSSRLVPENQNLRGMCECARYPWTAALRGQLASGGGGHLKVIPETLPGMLTPSGAEDQMIALLEVYLLQDTATG